MDEIRRILSDMKDDKIAQEWSKNDIILKKLAISHEEVCLDSGMDLEIEEFVAHVLETKRMATAAGVAYP